MAAWKMIYLARRNPALAAEDFPQAWREHSALGRQCRNVQDKVTGVAQCSRILDAGDALAGVSTDYDGVNVLDLRDRQAADDIWNDAETLAIMRPDEPRVFSTYVRDFTLVTAEESLRAGEVCDVALFIFLRPQAGARLRVDGQALAAADGFAQAGRLLLNHVDGDCPPGYEYSHIIAAWYAGVEPLRAAFSGREVWSCLPAALRADLDLTGSVAMLTRVTHRRP